jgi:hypothetical protein
LLKANRFGDLRRSTLSWCRRTRISASNAARGRNSPTKAHQINLQRSLIGSEYRPIRGRGQPSRVCGRDRSAFGAPIDVIQGCACISGCYDLHPVLLSARADYIKLIAEEAHALSPQRHVERLSCPFLVAYAEHDTEEFRRHSEDFAEALRRAGRLSIVLRVAEINHFEIIELLPERSTVLFRAVLSHLPGSTRSH